MKQKIIFKCFPETAAIYNNDIERVVEDYLEFNKVNKPTEMCPVQVWEHEGRLYVVEGFVYSRFYKEQIRGVLCIEVALSIEGSFVFREPQPIYYYKDVGDCENVYSLRPQYGEVRGTDVTYQFSQEQHTEMVFAASKTGLGLVNWAKEEDFFQPVM